MARNATRRGVLASAALAIPLLASGCKGIAVLGTRPRPLPDVAVVQHAIASERDLIERYTAVLAAMPALAPQLRPLLAQHADHLARLRRRLAGPPTPGSRRRSPRPVVPPQQADALAALRAAEDTASASLLAQLRVASPSLAQLLASIAASEASHALLLRGPGHTR